jgi:hypothetical protein
MKSLLKKFVLLITLIVFTISCSEDVGVEKKAFKEKNKSARLDQAEACYDRYQQVCYSGDCGGWTFIGVMCFGSGGVTPSSNASINLLQGVSFGGGGGSLNSILQNPELNTYYNNLTQAEKDYFATHWADIPQASANKRNAENLTNAMYCRDDDLGNWNAFKHAIWSSLNVWKFGTAKALLMGQNHESESLPGNERDMDFHNNDLGVAVYRAAVPFPQGISEVEKIRLLANHNQIAIGNGRGMRIDLGTYKATDNSDVCNFSPAF